jgi:hypothetical protein
VLIYDQFLNMSSFEYVNFEYISFEYVTCQF